MIRRFVAWKFLGDKPFFPDRARSAFSDFAAGSRRSFATREEEAGFLISQASTFRRRRRATGKLCALHPDFNIFLMSCLFLACTMHPNFRVHVT